MKITSVLLSASILLELARASTSDTEEKLRLTNWAGNIEFTADEVVSPQTEAELQDIVRNAKGQVKVAGTRHCFNDIADTPGTQISLEKFTDIEVDVEA